MRILIADDNEDGRAMLQAVLESKGYAVEAAADGAQALEMAKRKPPQLIISDILMPQMDGFDLCRAVKTDERLKEIPFIFYTAAHTDTRDEELALSLGASRYIVKPLGPAALIEIVTQTLEYHEPAGLKVPETPARAEPELEEIHEESLSRQLDKKLRELEKKNAALRKNEEKFRAVVDQASDPIFIIDKEGRVVDVNHASCQSLGYSREELLAMRVSDIEVGMSLGQLKEVFASVVDTGQSAILDTTLRPKEGSALLAEVKVGRLQWVEKGLLLAIARDVTVKRKVEDTLRFVLRQGWVEKSPRFLQELVRHLAQTMGSEYAFVGKLKPDAKSVKTVALYAHGEIAPNIEYELGETPCEHVVGQNLCMYPDGVQNLFPKDDMLVEMKADSYAGVPLWDASGTPSGLIAILGQTPLKNLSLVENLLPVVAVRASHEIEKMTDEAQIRDYRKNLEAMVEERTTQLEVEINERKKAEEDLREKVEDLRRFSALAVGREERMIELKKEVNSLLAHLGQKKRYTIPG